MKKTQEIDVKGTVIRIVKFGVEELCPYNGYGEIEL